MSKIEVNTVMAVRWATFVTVTSDDGVESKYCFLVDQEGPEMDNIVGFGGAEVTDEVRDLIAQLPVEKYQVTTDE
jgi:hypothetical protein